MFVLLVGREGCLSIVKRGVTHGAGISDQILLCTISVEWSMVLMKMYNPREGTWAVRT
jgi:hypothetical protein